MAAISSAGRTRLQGLLKALSDRANLSEDMDRHAASRQILDLVRPLADELAQDRRAPLDEQPPRRIAVAMAQALHSQPHLAGTFERLQRDGTEAVRDRERWPAEFPLALSSDVLGKALGLSEWELDDLREEVDRRTGLALKQERALHWLWTHFDLPDTSPDTLFQVLFPGTNTKGGRVGLVRRGGHMYAVVDQEQAPALEALYLPWLGLANDLSYPPLRTFHSKYVDPSLLRALGRGIGADDDEAAELFEHMVSIVPREGAAQFLVHDQWRARGMAALTDMGSPYPAGSWLVRPLPPDSADWTSWLRSRDAELVQTANPVRVFDELALPRLQAMLRLLYQQMLASMDRRGPDSSDTVEEDDLVLYDLNSHVRAVLQPLLQWSVDRKTQAFMAQTLDLDEDQVSLALTQVAATWRVHAEEEYYPGDGSSRMAQRLASHLIATNTSLKRVFHNAADLRWEHRDMLLLFAAHYFREAPVERLWLSSLSNSLDAEPGSNGELPPEDVLGDWFWGLWMRVLNLVESESMITGRF